MSGVRISPLSPDEGHSSIKVIPIKDEMKRIQADFPFSNFWLYKVWHSKEGRWQANLVSIANIKERTTVSYARYLYSVSIGRELLKDEHVDHIDEDKSNDTLSNLQLLSPEENKRKSEAHRNLYYPKFLDLECAFCGKNFTYPSRNFKFYSKKGRYNFTVQGSVAHLNDKM